MTTRREAKRDGSVADKAAIQEPVLLKEEQVAKLLKVSRRTLQGWRLEGKGPPYHRISGCIRYDQAELLRYIASTRRRSTSDPGPDGE
jgi:hypothetical protein